MRAQAFYHSLKAAAVGRPPVHLDARCACRFTTTSCLTYLTVITLACKVSRKGRIYSKSVYPVSFQFERQLDESDLIPAFATLGNYEHEPTIGSAHVDLALPNVGLQLEGTQQAAAASSVTTLVEQFTQDCCALVERNFATGEQVVSL